MKKFFSGLIVLALALNFVSAFGTEAGAVRAVYTERGVTTEITYDDNNHNIATRRIIVAPTMGYLSPDASGTFQKIHVVSFDKSTLWMPNVFSFKHKGNTRILVGENGRTLEFESLDLSSQLPEGRISVYEPSDLTKPLARKYLASTDISRIPIEIGDVSEYGDNIIIGGEGGFAGILEVNPENCNIVANYNEGNFMAAETAVKGERIYAVIVNNDYTEKLIRMNGLGNIRETHYGDNRYYSDIKVINDEVYFSVGYTSTGDIGLYKVREKIEVPSAEKITQDAVRSFCDDGNGGLFYTKIKVINLSGSFLGGLLNEFEELEFNETYSLCHWDGTNIFDIGLSMDVGHIHYDVNSKKLFAWGSPDEGTSIFIYNVSGEGEGMQVVEAQKIEGKFKSIAFLNDEENEAPIVNPVDPTPVSPTDNTNTLSSPNGTCSTGFGILCLAILGAGLILKHSK